MSLAVEATALRDFLSFFTELSTIPVTIRPEALLQNQVTLDNRVTLRGDRISLQVALKNSLEKLNLAAELHQGHLRVITRVASENATRVVSYSIGPLIDGATGSQADASRRLADEVQKLTGLMHWSSHRGPCSLQIVEDEWRVTATEPIHFELTLLLDQLRAARGLKRESAYPERWFAGATCGRRVQPLLQTELTLHVVEPVPLHDLLDQISRQADCHLLVDWASLAGAGWSYDQPVVLNVESRTLAETLSKLLTPMQLVARGVDDRVLQITTRAAELTEFDRESYPVAALLDAGHDPQQITQRIYEFVGIERFHAGGGTGHVYVDPVGRVALVRLPQSQQFVVDRLLNEN